MILVLPARVPSNIISHRAYTVRSLSPMEPLPFPPGDRVPLQYCDPLSHISNPGSYPYRLELSKVLELCSGWPAPIPGPLMLENNRNKIRMACHETEQIAHNVVTLKSKSTSVHVEYEGSFSANITKGSYYDKGSGIELGFLNS